MGEGDDDISFFCFSGNEKKDAALLTLAVSDFFYFVLPSFFLY